MPSNVSAVTTHQFGIDEINAIDKAHRIRLSPHRTYELVVDGIIESGSATCEEVILVFYDNEYDISDLITEDMFTEALLAAK